MSFVDDLIDRIIDIEGGYVNDPSDSGGETNFGITKKTAVRYGYNIPMRSMTKTHARNIYREMYWDSISGTAIMMQSSKLAEELFDISVNMGVRRAGEFLQRSLNALNNQGEYYADISVDGNIGPATIKALRSYMAKRRFTGERVILNMINCLQGAFYVELVERREKDERFIYGWMKHRVGII